MRTPPDRKYYAVNEGGLAVLTVSTSSPPGGVELTPDQAHALSADIDARYQRPITPQATATDAGVAEILNEMALKLKSVSDEVEAIKSAPVVVGVDRG